MNGSCGGKLQLRRGGQSADLRRARVLQLQRFERTHLHLRRHVHVRQQRQYDLENRLTTGTTSYTWDFENRLTSVTLPGTGGTVNFNYDPFGRRIEKIAPTSGTTVYAYDGDNVTEELGAGGNLLAHYTQGAGIDEPLAMTGIRRNLLLSCRRLGFDYLTHEWLGPTGQ